VATAHALQVKRWRTLCRAATDTLAASSGWAMTLPIAKARAPASPGCTRRAVTPSSPTTSGKAPPDVLTNGTPQAIASTAGSENPSSSDGTTATDAWAYSSTIRSLLTADSNATT